MICVEINDGIDCQVTYPDDTNTSVLPKNTSGLANYFANKNTTEYSKTPVIILLGWMGAKDRHLAKYSAIYNKHGFITIRYILPTLKLFFMPNWNIPPIVDKLLGLLKELQLSSHPIVFHSFSNNGAWMYYHISDALRTDEYKHLIVKGCIFDSCPGIPSIFSAFLATYRTTPSNVVLRFLSSSCLVSYLTLWKVCLLIHSVFTLEFSLDLKKRSPYGVVAEPFRWPQLFIYSKQDDLILYSEIENFAAEREKLGVIVHKKEFVSPHVLHQKYHPEEYGGTVEKFLDVCFPQNNEILDV